MPSEGVVALTTYSLIKNSTNEPISGKYNVSRLGGPYTKFLKAPGFEGSDDEDEDEAIIFGNQNAAMQRELEELINTAPTPTNATRRPR